MLAYLLILLIFVFCNNVHCLTCFKTNENNEVVQVEDPEYSYCVFFPKHHSKNGYVIKNFVDGVKYNEADPTYNAFFQHNDRYYTALAVCLHEVDQPEELIVKASFERSFQNQEINWPALWKWNANRAGKTPKVEYVLRCVCKTNLCNNPMELEESFDAIKVQSS